MKNKKILFTILTIVILSLSGCNDDSIFDNSIGSYSDDIESFEGFVNPEKQTAKFDENIVLDGSFEEEEYQNSIWWEEKYVTPSDEVTVRVTSYFGEKGIFMGFDVDDEYVYVNELRTSYNNSGLEIYLAAPGATSLPGTTFEIDILPNNTIHPKFYFNGYFWAYPAPEYKAPFMGTKLKGGKLNTRECKGYSMEVYFPYEYLFNVDEKPEYINFNVALLRATSADKNNSDRLWYNFGENFNSSYNWGNPETFWKFGESGLVANRIELSSNDLGSISTEKNYVTNFSDVKFDITPNDGTYLKTLLLNGEEVTDSIRYDEENKPYYLAKKVTEDINLEAEFAVIKEEKTNIYGLITYNGSKLTKEELTNLSIKFRTKGITYDGSLYENSKYVLGNLPLTNGELVIISNEGYEVINKEIDLSLLSNGEININFTDDEYGPNRIIKLDSVDSVNGSRKQLYSNDFSTNEIGSNFVYSFNLKYDGTLFDENGILVPDPSNGTHNKQYSSFNLTGNMVNSNNTEIGDFNMQIMHWNSNGYWMIKLWVDGKEINTMLGIDFLRDLSTDGVNLILVNEDRKITIYQSFNGALFKIIEHSSSEDEKPWYLSELNCYGEYASINSSWSVSDSQLAFNKDNDDIECLGQIRSLDSHHQFKEVENKVAETSVCWNTTNVKVGGFTSNIIIPGLTSNEVKPFTTGFRCHTYNPENDSEHFGAYIYLIYDGENYYVSTSNKLNETSNKLKLNEYQIAQLSSTGLLVGFYKNDKQFTFFVEDNDKIVEFGHSTSWFDNPTALKFVDLMHDGDSSLGFIYTENTKIYSINTEISKEEFFEIFGGTYE